MVLGAAMEPVVRDIGEAVAEVEAKAEVGAETAAVAETTEVKVQATIHSSFSISTSKKIPVICMSELF